MKNFGSGIQIAADRLGRWIVLIVSMAIGWVVSPAARADAVFGQAELAPLAAVLEQPRCMQQCETSDWRIRSVSAPAGVGRLLDSSDALFLVSGKLPNYCGASRCVEAYVIRDASSLRVIKSGYEISRTSPLTAGDIPPTNARGPLASVLRAPAIGWNQGKQAIARDILADYSNDLDVINRVADNADYAVLAWAAYMADAPEALAAAKDRGWTPFKSYAIENSAVGDTIAILFIANGSPAVLAFRGTEGDGDGTTNTKGIVLDDPKYTAQVLGARTLALEVVAAQPNVVFVGHSLGGRLAQVAGASTGRPAVAFNSSPLGNQDRELALGSPKQAPSATIRFRSPNDPLTALFSPLDISVANIEVSNLLTFGNIRFAHNMGVLAKAMQDVRIARDERWIASYLAGVTQQANTNRPATAPPVLPASGCPQGGAPGQGQRTLADCVAQGLANMASAVKEFNTARADGRVSGALGQAMSGVIARNPQVEAMQLATCQRLAKAGANELSTAACLALVWSKDATIRRESSDILDRVSDDVNGRIASNRLPLTTVPPVYVVKGGCPGEGCKFGMWTAKGNRPLLDNPGSSTVVAQVARGERVAALRSELRVRPVKGIVVGRIDHLKQGETIYLMDYVGEGLSNVWARGQVFADPRGDNGCTPTPLCKSAIRFPLEKAPQEWWVRVQKRNGESGWIRADINPGFNGMSWLERDSAALLDPYDTPPGSKETGVGNPVNLPKPASETQSSAAGAELIAGDQFQAHTLSLRQFSDRFPGGRFLTKGDPPLWLQGQCIAWAKVLYSEVSARPVKGVAFGSARNIPDVLKSQGFTIVKDPAKPRVGSMVVWDDGGAGHVGVVVNVELDATGAAATGITVSEANWGPVTPAGAQNWALSYELAKKEFVTEKYGTFDEKFFSVKELDRARFRFAGYVYP